MKNYDKSPDETAKDALITYVTLITYVPGMTLLTILSSANYLERIILHQFSLNNSTGTHTGI